MMQFLKPTRDNLNASLSIGIPLIALSFIDFFSNTFLNSNITSFLPDTLSYFFPLIIGTLGLYFVRIEFSGIRLLDNFNKNVNSSTFNYIVVLIYGKSQPSWGWLGKVGDGKFWYT